MTAHVLYKALDDQLPATLSPNIITHLLREQMGYDGVVLTDDLEMHAIVDHYGPGEAAVRAFLAGCDMLLICKDRDREDCRVRGNGKGRRVRDDRHVAARSVSLRASSGSSSDISCRIGRW